MSWYQNGSLIPMGNYEHWAWRQGSTHHLHVYGITSAVAGVYAAAAYTATQCVWAFCRVQHKGMGKEEVGNFQIVYFKILMFFPLHLKLGNFAFLVCSVVEFHDLMFIVA